MSDLTPDKIFSSYKHRELDKTTSLNYLRTIIENIENGKVRRDAVLIFTEIGGKSEEVFEYLEELLVSDNYPIVRSTAADVIIRNFLNHGRRVLKHVISYEHSTNCLLGILESLEHKVSGKDEELIKYWYGEIYEWLKDLFRTSPRDDFEGLSAQELIGLIILMSNVKDSSFDDYYAPKIKIKDGHVVLISLNEINGMGNESLKQMPDLKELEFRNCYPGNLTGLSNLRTLNIFGGEYRKLKSIKSLTGLDTLVNLEHLNLSGNALLKIDDLESLINLKTLNLSFNYISELENLSHLKNLESLNLFILPILEIQNLENLGNLQELELSTDEKLGNSITEIKNLETLTNLKKLSLANRDIIEINGLDNLRKLELLNLSGNDLTEIKELNNLENLQYLDLARNKITELKNLGHLTNLRGLSIVKNKIRNITMLENLKNLEILNIDKDYFIEIDVLSKLKNLKWLYYDNWFDFNHWFKLDNKQRNFRNQIKLVRHKTS